MIRISVIVPVYNVEEYLGRCIDSILAQTVTDFELILIDDGSSDKSPEICDEYKKRDNRIKVIHQENKGAAAARNVGIQNSTGEYIMFCDSDDYVSPYWIEHLLIYIGKNVIPIGSYCFSSNLDKLGKMHELPAKAGELYPVSFLWEAGIIGCYCCSLFDREIIFENQISFRENKEKGDYNEDIIFTLAYISKIDYMVYTGYSDYLYDKTQYGLSSASIAKKFYYEKFEEKYSLLANFIEKYVVINKEKNLKRLSDELLYHFLHAMQISVENNDKRKYIKIVKSSEIQKCILLADSSKENQTVINFIKSQQINKLWVYLRLANIKKRISRK